MALLTPETLVYEAAAVADPQVSPDGTRLLYTIAKADREADRGTSQVWLSALDGSDARQLSGAGDRNREGRWSPDGRSIAFVSDRVKDSSGIYVLSATGPGEAREVTRHRPAIGRQAGCCTEGPSAPSTKRCPTSRDGRNAARPLGPQGTT